MKNKTFPKISSVQQQTILCVGGAQHLTEDKTSAVLIHYNLSISSNRVNGYRFTTAVSMKTLHALEKKGLVRTFKPPVSFGFNRHPQQHVELTPLGWEVFDKLAEENQEAHKAYEEKLDQVRTENFSKRSFTVAMMRKVVKVKYQRCDLTILAESEEEAFALAQEVRHPRWFNPYSFSRKGIPKDTEEVSEPTLLSVQEQEVKEDSGKEETPNTAAVDEAVRRYKSTHPAPETFKGVAQYIREKRK